MDDPKPMLWGYALKAPGRPPLRAQAEFLRKQGVDISIYGQLWSDEIKHRLSKTRSLLVGREDLLNCAMPGDTAIILEPFCLGLGMADVKWFLSTLAEREVRLIVGRDEVSDDTMPSILDDFARQQNTQNVRASRSGKPGRRLAKLRKERPAPPPEIPGAKRPCVYRHFDACGDLLYVGACQNYEKRLDQHKRGARWLKKMKSFTIEFHPTIAEAREAERVAIWLEKPLYNRQRIMPCAGDLLDAAAKLVADEEIAQRVLALKT